MKDRSYNFRDVDMLQASRTVANNFLVHLEELKPLRMNWDGTYAEELLERIDNTIGDYLGKDKKQALRETTEKVLDIKKMVANDLGFLKAQIKIDFPAEAEKILKKLGLNRSFSAFASISQEELIGILFRIIKEMDEDLKSKICSRGMNPTLIDRLIENADQLRHFNTLQESYKDSTKEITAEMREKFNRIYNEVSGICTIARIYYKSDPVLSDQFTFSGIVDNMHAR